MNTFRHCTDNPTDHTETTLDLDQVSVSWNNNPSAHFSLRRRFGFLAEQASLTGNEPEAQLGDLNSTNFASMQGDSGISSAGSSSSTWSGKAFVASAIPVADSLSQAPRDPLRQQEGWSSRGEQIVRNVRRYYKHKGHDALHQQQRSHEEQMFLQQWEAD